MTRSNTYCTWNTERGASDVSVFQRDLGEWVIMCRASRPIEPLAEGEAGMLVMMVTPDDASMRLVLVGGDPDGAPTRDVYQTPIEAPFSAQTWVFETPGECATMLDRLESLGCQVPSGVIERLRDVQASYNIEPVFTDAA